MRALLVALAFGTACQSMELHIDPETRNIAPFADAGTGGTYDVGQTVTLDAIGSYDPDGVITKYHWAVTGRPMGSNSLLGDEAAPATSFELDAPGEYTFELMVTDDGRKTATSTVVVQAEALELLSVNAGPDQSIPLGATAQLTGMVDAEMGAGESVNWVITSRPVDSTATLSLPSTLTPTFVTDREGAYVVRLIVTTPWQTEFDNVTITATVARQLLEYTLVDAEYSTALDRYIIVSDSPARLRIHDPATNTASVVTLAEAPVAVSVSPDGLRAAVGHAKKVSIVDLQTLAVTGPYDIPWDPTTSMFDIVFGADNRVHCFHTGINSEPIKTLRLSNGTVIDSDEYISDETNARLHPGGLIVYGADTAVSPADIERYNVGGVTVQVVGDSPYHGDYEMGGPLWFTEDGGLIITASGNLFYSSSNAQIDMTYAGTIGLGSHPAIVHSAIADTIAAVRIEYNNVFNPTAYLLRLYDDQQFTLIRSEQIPDTPYNGTTYLSAGRFIAFNASGTKIYVIARAGAAPGVVHALYTVNP